MSFPSDLRVNNVPSCPNAPLIPTVDDPSQVGFAIGLMRAGPLGALAAYQRSFWREDRVAALLWAPYLAWVSFATALNATIWWLNR